jgi:ubiquinone/menaquinone biosynthesis C-methylase UbiE
MALIDKKHILKSIGDKQFVELELGCGNRKRVQQAIGVDMLDYDCVDIVGDVFEVLGTFPNASVSAIHSYHFIEHISDLGKLMDEIGRVLKKGGSIHFVVPHFSNPYFYSDYTHKSFFGLYTFCYFCTGGLFKRVVPSYQRDIQFELTKVDLVFKSTPPFYLRHALKVVIGKIVNLSTYTRELYEENFCYLFPCYEISYHLRRI